eukprot:351641-Chlamydomonas_euryale.AAC.4
MHAHGGTLPDATARLHACTCGTLSTATAHPHACTWRDTFSCKSMLACMHMAGRSQLQQHARIHAHGGMLPAETACSHACTWRDAPSCNSTPAYTWRDAPSCNSTPACMRMAGRSQLQQHADVCRHGRASPTAT